MSQSLDELIEKTEEELRNFIVGANTKAAEIRGRIAGLKMAQQMSKPIAASPVEQLPHDMSVEA